ncbi:MAG: hypothetical protein SGJ27_31270 [Candidatus Melainabacteria bacterium]|nr:hypothetical protein [Candidatus Melainabacteria bacterium]
MTNVFYINLSVVCFLLFAQPAISKNIKYTHTTEHTIEIQQSQPSWARTRPASVSRFTPGQGEVKAQPINQQAKTTLPGTPMGAAVRQPGDYLYQKRAGGTHSQVRQGKGLAGLPDTKMGATVGMAGDHVGKQRSAVSSHNAMGLPSTSLGATVGSPGDGIRTDIRNGYKHSPARMQPIHQKVSATSKQSSAPTTNYAATYGSYDGKKKRNY